MIIRPFCAVHQKYIVEGGGPHGKQVLIQTGADLANKRDLWCPSAQAINEGSVHEELDCNGEDWIFEIEDATLYIA